MLTSFLRTIILYSALILVIRLMGKRQLGQMEPTEFVVTLLIADLASVPMQDDGIPLFSGLIPILVVLALELLLSVLVYSNVPMRRFLCGKPVILLAHGKLLQQNMKKTRINTDELNQHLRQNGFVDPSEIRYAILETNGTISILPEPKFLPASAKDAGVKASDFQLPVTVISHGQLVADNLSRIGKSKAWVEQKLENYHCQIKDVFLLMLQPDGKLFLSLEQEDV